MSMGTTTRTPLVDYNEGPVQLPPWSRRRWSAVIALLVAVTALASIPLVSQLVDDEPATVDGPEILPTTVPVAPTAPATTAPTVEDVIRTRYLEFWRAYLDYSSKAGPFDPVEFRSIFAPLATSGQYTHVLENLQLDRARGIAGRGGGVQDHPAHEVAITGPTTATIRDCAADTGELYNVNTGEAITAPREGRNLLLVDMVLEDGLWKVASIADTEEPCIA